MTTPAGLPEVDALDTYGGAKNNAEGVVDITSEEDAAERNLMAANVAAMTHTLDRAWVRFLGHATTPTLAVGNAHDACWGNGLNVEPEITNAGTGVYDIAWPEEVTDELLQVHAVNLRAATPWVEGPTPYLVTTEITAPNTVRLRVFAAGGAANNAVGVTLGVRVS